MLQREKTHFFRQSTILCLIVAFLGIKWIQQTWAEDSLRHLLVAALLLALPAIFGPSSLRSSFRELMTSRVRREDVFVLVYLLLPFFLNILFFSETWQQTQMHLQSWVWSQMGVLSILSAPLAEEYFFRGWFLKRQLHSCDESPEKGFWCALKLCYLNAIVFWIMHMPIDFTAWKHALQLGGVPVSPGPFLLGLITTALTLRTGQLRAAVLFHACANASGPLWWPILGNEFLRSVFYH